MKGTLFFLACAFALVFCDEEVELNANGCPVDPTIHKTIAHEKYCNLFYSCNGGNLIELRCPGELVFNAAEQVCDWKANVNCQDKDIKPEDSSESGESVEASNPGGNTDPSQAGAICAGGESDGVLVAHENCNRYNLCDKGLPVVMKCPPGLMYNYDLGICDWAFNVECGERTIAVSSEEED